MPGTDEHFQFLVPCYQCHRHVQCTAVPHLDSLDDGKGGVVIFLYRKYSCCFSECLAADVTTYLQSIRDVVEGEHDAGMVHSRQPVQVFNQSRTFCFVVG